MEAFLPIFLSPNEKEAFADYLRERYNYSEATIKSAIDCLTLISAKTRNSMAKARWARRRYEEFKKLKGGEDGI